MIWYAFFVFIFTWINFKLIKYDLGYGRSKLNAGDNVAIAFFALLYGIWLIVGTALLIALGVRRLGWRW